MATFIEQESLGRVLYRDDYYCMDDGPLHRQFISDWAVKASGKVLCLGLGLGVMVEYLRANPNVTQIDCVEIDQEIVDLVGAEGIDNLFIADANTFIPETFYDWVYLDIWSEHTPETVRKLWTQIKRYELYSSHQWGLLLDYEGRI